MSFKFVAGRGRHASPRGRRLLELRNCGGARESRRPAGIESEMSHRLAELRVVQTVLQPALEMEAELLRIAIGRERDDGDEAAIAGRQVAAPPQITEQNRKHAGNQGTRCAYHGN